MNNSGGLAGRDAWQELVRRYADGRKICNCGAAYFDQDGNCAYGCTANRGIAKEEIAEHVLAELEQLPRRAVEV